ncbi:hypothetical protein, variant [Aphanomyces astaci]|uniref:Multiple inositol polyphosphate phosphatase 1 n=1 Tax=Aphanomyces astaci TaxID=112090 RepID=W4GMY7_APHAT|nr:hypothetical protein, variant [Aphanomyces astaci]ETV80263.1 hypothetical protein, variant [Aphanomyces astaci]|eukprot:XP_009830187.1 hypothetical protein, variant [Aphanomyces astaci]
MTRSYKSIEHHRNCHVGRLAKRILVALPVLAIGVVLACRWWLDAQAMQPLVAATSSLVVFPLSTNTPYAMSGSVEEPHEQPKNNWSTCSLVQINAVYRHGTRYPMESDYIKMQRTLHELQTAYNSTLPQWLQTYAFSYPQSVSELLAPAGEVEMEGLGRRARMLADRYSLPSRYSPDAFVFEHTHVLRTKQSAERFAAAYFADTPSPPNISYKCQPQGQDISLRFFDNCPKYKAWVRYSTNMTIQTKAFEETSRALAMVAQLRDAGLHLPPSASFQWSQLMAVYDACAFDVALFNTSSMWCSLFPTRDLLLLDFHSDLKKYYECGPGFAISVAIAAPLLADMLATMTATDHPGSAAIAYFRFAHAETVLPLACLLGMCSSTSPLVASWTEAQIHHRQFKVSRLSPFASNLAFHVYKCGKNDEKRVKFLANEVEVDMPFCHEKGYCTLDDLQQHFYTAVAFDFQNECKL